MNDSTVQKDRSDQSPPFLIIEDKSCLLRAIINLEDISNEQNLDAEKGLKPIHGEMVRRKDFPQWTQDRVVQR